MRLLKAIMRQVPVIGEGNELGERCGREERPEPEREHE